MERLCRRPRLQDQHLVILTKPSTEAVAGVMAQALRLRGWELDVRREYLSSDRGRLHLVLAPQGYSRLPPLRIACQFEQHVATQYFTAADWMLLGAAEDILEYSRVNMDYLYQDTSRFRAVCHLPPCPDLAVFHVWARRSRLTLKQTDLFFVGAMNPRRQRILSGLQQHFTVMVADNLYGDALREAMASCRAVLNIHYYENAVHEVVRVQESMACGLPVISETSSDQDSFEYPDGWISFVQDPCSPAGLDAIRHFLAQHAVAPPDLDMTEAWIQQRFSAYSALLDARVSAAYARLASHETV